MGCLRLPGENCHQPSETGSCTDYVDKWFFDANYGQFCSDNSDQYSVRRFDIFQVVAVGSGTEAANQGRIILRLKMCARQSVLSPGDLLCASCRK